MAGCRSRSRALALVVEHGPSPGRRPILCRENPAHRRLLVVVRLRLLNADDRIRSFVVNGTPFLLQMHDLAPQHTLHHQREQFGEEFGGRALYVSHWRFGVVDGGPPQVAAAQPKAGAGAKPAAGGGGRWNCGRN